MLHNLFSSEKPMRRVRIKCLPGLALAVWLAGGAVAQEAKTVASLTELRQRLAEHVSQPKFTAAMWGVKVVSLDTGKILFEHNAQKLFSPASNSKLFTVALAFEQFGPEYRVKTSLYGLSKPDPTGTLEGDLIVYGRGDPGTSARQPGGDIYRALQPLVAALTNAGVRRIAGDLVGDESYFRGPIFGSGWTWEDTESAYGAEISALTINDNVFHLTVRPGERSGAPCRLSTRFPGTLLSLSNLTVTANPGQRRTIHFERSLKDRVLVVAGQMASDDAGYTEGIPVQNPARVFVSLLREAVARNGIQVTGTTRTMNWRDRETNPIAFDQMVELGSASSWTLAEWAKHTLKSSQNLYADLLLAQVGEHARGSSPATNQSSEELGIAALAKFLAQAGINRDEVLFDEGSGLSRNNLATPNATVALLAFAARRPWAEVFLQALPVAGVDGTLRDRMKGTAAEGKVRAKTGTLRWIHSLSGHATTVRGERLVFSIMLNRYHATEPSRPARAEVDALAVMLAEFGGRSDD
jgi:D-alanyl-D-alanine carboxypeptidase/D-alanyl-D-alanine-endopeptidase (penicillin-binding protein 4)